MAMEVKEGHLFMADLTEYTPYLIDSELEHAETAASPNVSGPSGQVPQAAVCDDPEVSSDFVTESG